MPAWNRVLRRDPAVVVNEEGTVVENESLNIGAGGCKDRRAIQNRARTISEGDLLAFEVGRLPLILIGGCRSLRKGSGEIRIVPEECRTIVRDIGIAQLV